MSMEMSAGTALVEATKAGNLPEVKRLLARPDAKDFLNATDEDEESPMYRRATSVWWATRHGINVQTSDGTKYLEFAWARFGTRGPIAHVAAVLCDPECADQDLRNAEQLNQRVAIVKRGGCTFDEKARRVQQAGALALIIINSDNELFAVSGDDSASPVTIPVLLVASGADATLLQEGSNVTLVGGRIDILQELIGAGADVNLASQPQMANLQTNVTPISIAAADGHTEAIRALILAGADPDIPCDPSGFTAIHFAAERGHAEAITALIQRGADPNIADKDKRTPFSIAATNTHLEALEALLEGGADPDKMVWAGRIHLVKGVDDGRRAWYYVLVEPRRIPSFLLAALNDNNIHLENYGQILKSGYGEAPPPCVAQALEDLLRTGEQFPTGSQERIAEKVLDMWKMYANEREKKKKMEEEEEEPTADQLRLVLTAQELFQGDNWLSLADMTEELLRTAQALLSAKPEWAGVIFSWLGVCYKSLGRYTKAIELHEQCLKIQTEVGDRAGQGGTFGNLGSCYLSLGQYAKAIELHEQRLTIATEVGDRAGQGNAWGSLGSCYLSLGQYAKAIELHEQRLAIATEVGDRAGQGGTLGNLGSCYERLGQYPKAIELHEQRLAIATEVGDRAGQGKAWGNLGNCYTSLGLYTKAIELHEQCLKIEKEMGDRAGQGGSLGNLGNCYYRLGQYAKAIELHEQRLAIAEEVGDRAGQGRAWGNLGICYRSLGQYTKAIEHLEQQLAITEEVGNRAGEGGALGNLGICYYSLGQYTKAIEHHEQLLAIATEVGDRAGQGNAWGSLGICYDSLGQYPKAIQHLEQHLTIAEEVGDRAGQGKAWGNLGICYRRLGQYPKAIEHLEQQLAIAEEVGDRAGQGSACNNLGTALAKNGDDKGAARVLLRGLAVWQRVEEDVGAHDDRRVSLLEEQQKTYRQLQDVLMRQEGRAGWALGVAAEGKARALAYRLGAVGESYGGGGDSEDGEQLADRPYEDVCESWWVEVQRLARGEGATTRVIEFSFLFDGKMGIWVLSGDTGELRCSKVVSSTGLAGSRGLSIQEALAEARKSMGVRGRDAMREARDAVWASTREATELLDASHATDEPALSVRGPATKEDLIKAELKSSRKKVQTAREILSELTVKVVVLSDKIFYDWMVHRKGIAYRKMPSVVSWFKAHCSLQERQHMAYRKMPSLVLTLYERVQHLLQEAHIRVQDSHPDKLGKDDSIDDLKEQERLLWVSRDALDEVLREIAEMLLKELYQALIAPVEAALEGAEELLIVPHKELFEVPWAALTDADGSYLIERYVIRTAPSLRVARQAADKMQQQMQQDGKQAPGHVVLVGNPLPTRLPSLPFAEEEVKDIEDILKRAGVDVHAEHHFRPDRNAPATKSNVKRSLEGADWAHMACHADLETDALVLAIPRGSVDQGTHVKMVASLPCALETCKRNFFKWFKEVVAVVAHVEPEVVSITGSEIEKVVPKSSGAEIQRSTRIEVRLAVLPQPHHQQAEEIRKRLTEVAIKSELVSKKWEQECRRSHKLSMLSSHSSWNCDVCSARKTYNPRLRCDTCDFDVCESCSGPAAQQLCNICLVEAAAVVADLSMLEVQGSEGAQGVRLAQGATVVLSACNTGRGEIKAEGVVGLARGFLLASASAAVVSLWSVDDGSTAALMRIKYSHLAEGCTVAQALRLAMLRLARRPPQTLGQKQTSDRAAGAAPAPLSDDSVPSEAWQDGHCDELKEAWKRPYHWAAFLVVGATTSLRRHSPNIPLGGY